jgi:hypothetical protein
MAKETDKHLLDALVKAYTARAKLFHSGVRAANIDLLIAEIDAIDGDRLKWDLRSLGISPRAMKNLKEAGGSPHQVFAHPAIISSLPHLIAYYRNIVTISKKGISQVLFPTERFESGKSRIPTDDQCQRICQTFNRILSGLIEDIPSYSVHLSRQSILAEIGAGLQGTWANAVGQGAAKAVENLLEEYLKDQELGERAAKGRFQLANGWQIHFGSEPDVSFVDPHGAQRIAIEIKGSLDVAGAQTRYGEAKKTFGKALADNPRCHTIYLASCFTDSVIEQIKIDGQVRDWFNLTSILYDDHEKQTFLETLFHVVNSPR